MGGKSVLVLVLVVVEAFVWNDLRNRKSLIVNDGDRDLTCLYELLDKDLLVVGSRIIYGCIKFIL